MPFRLITLDVAFDTPNLVDPGDYGPHVTTLAAGEFIEGSVLQLTDWDQPVNWELTLIETDAGPTRRIFNGRPFLSSQPTTVVTHFPYPESISGDLIAAYTPGISQAVVPAFAAIAAYPTGSAPAAGTARVVLKIYS